MANAISSRQDTPFEFDESDWHREVNKKPELRLSRRETWRFLDSLSRKVRERNYSLETHVQNQMHGYEYFVICLAGGEQTVRVRIAQDYFEFLIAEGQFRRTFRRFVPSPAKLRVRRILRMLKLHGDVPQEIVKQDLFRVLERK